MTEQFFTRAGIKCVHVAPPGSLFVPLADGRYLVTHCAYAPYVVSPDGSTQHLAIRPGDESWRHQ
jgi:hypothetical protein